MAGDLVVNIMRILNIALVGTMLLVSSGPSVAAVDVEELLRRCAPTVDPQTMRAVLSAESSGNIFAVADAGPLALPWSQRKSLVRSHNPASLSEAIALVNGLLQKGHTVSLGLSQINDRNLAALGLSVETVFEPCANISGGASILSSFYKSAVKTYGGGPRALRAALSAYNSGSFVRGEQDGYVDLVVQKADKPLVLKEGTGGSMVVPSVSTLGIRPAGGWVQASNNAHVAGSIRKKNSDNIRWRGGKDFTMLVSAFDEN